ncbi:MAG: ATP-binding protein [Spirochaetaceae bacterium]|nr:ATP-binding protein [Spirochaetaceae bacterium]
MNKRPELIAALIYMTVGALWIVFSDSLVHTIASGSSTLTVEKLQLAKGFFFVAASGILVYLLVRSSTRRTQRHNAELEQHIAARTAELSDLYHRAPCGYHSLDSEGRFVRVNDCEIEWLGYSREELLGTRFSDYLEPESLRIFKQNFPGFMLTGEVENLEFILRRRDGSKLPILLNATAIRDEEGKYIMSRSNMFDMTELLEAREDIESLNRELTERNRELETRNSDLASFSYSISHDLRAPVRAITGFSEIIARRHGTTLPDEARHYLNNITAAGNRMNRLIDDLLRYARLGSTSLEIVPLALEPLLEGLSSEFTPTLEPLSGSLHCAAGHLHVRAEHSLLEQILSNLLENAIRYRSPTRPPVISIEAAHTDGGVEIAVADNGIGIPPEHHERIFSLFQRLQNDDEEGTGIGLALARRAAELLGGSLSLTSIPDVGTTFILTLQEAPR